MADAATEKAPSAEPQRPSLEVAPTASPVNNQLIVILIGEPSLECMYARKINPAI